MTEEKHNPEDVCAICNGVRFLNMRQCPYCNGTGEWNKAADAYWKNHMCQCIFFDRETCPVCNKKCHHDTTLSPKVIVGPTTGGSAVNMDAGENASGTVLLDA